MGYFIAVLLILFLTPPAYADTHAAATCANTTGDYTVQAAVNAADDGDTVTVPAGSCTWDAPLEINKAIILQGAGQGVTNITSGLGDEDNKGVIYYNPTTADSAHRFRITGFTIDTNQNANGIYLNNATATPETIRIDHNTITSIGSTGGTRRGIYISGTFYGVIDNNTITALDGKIADSYGLNTTSWTTFESSRETDLGSANNIFFEDNTVTSANTFHSVGNGGRYVIRYNSYTYNGSTTLTPAFDILGGQRGGGYGGMIREIYGNAIALGSKGADTFFGERGGMCFDFYNNATTSSTIATYMREEYTDSLFPDVNTYVQHITNSYSWANLKNNTTLFSHQVDSENCCQNTEAWQASHDYATSLYCAHFSGDAGGNCWKARSRTSPYTTGESEPNWAGTAVGSTLTDGNYTWLNMGTADYPLTINVDFWTQSATGTFDGTGNAANGGGVGAGTLDNRPATCTTGTAYWATTQSVSDLTGMVGRMPSTPITGTLYKCTATNTWTAYYTPYTYPHPLTGRALKWIPFSK